MPLQNRELVIQRALLKAFEADVGEVDAIITQYEKVFTDDAHWPSILRAAAHWHAGRYKVRGSYSNLWSAA